MDQKDKLEILSKKELQFYFFLLLNTCHDCFPETLFQKEEKEFQLDVFPEDVNKRDIRPKPQSSFLLFASKIGLSSKLFSAKKNKKTILDDVPQESREGTFSGTKDGHYIYQDMNESNLNNIKTN